MPATTLANLETLVRKHNLPEIKKLVQQIKIERDYFWQFDENTDYITEAMHYAVTHNQSDIVKFLIDEGVNICSTVSLKRGDYRSYVAHAAEAGHLEMVKLLVENGAIVKEHNERMNTGDDSAIAAAVEKGYVTVVGYLLEKGATAHSVYRGMRRDTFLAHAAKNDHREIMDLLINFGAINHLDSTFGLAKEKYNERIEGIKRRLESVKDESAEKEKLEQSLKEECANVDKIVNNCMDYAVGHDFTDRYDNPLRVLNIIKNLKSNCQSVNWLGVSVNGAPVTRALLTELEFTGVDEAILTLADVEKIADLPRRTRLQARIDKAFQKQGILIENEMVNLVPFKMAAYFGKLLAVKARLAAGIDPNEDNAIVVAARAGHKTIVTLLLDHPKLDPKIKETVIKEAKKAGHLEIVECIIAQQNINKLDNDGNAALHYAVQYGDVEAVKKLLAQGADPNLKGRDGCPLYIAAIHSFDKLYEQRASADHIAIIKLLLEYHANPNEASASGVTAMSAAGSAGSAEALALLLPVTEKKALNKPKAWNHPAESLPWFTDILFDSRRSREWLQILMLLKKHDADFNQHRELDSEVILHFALRTFPSFDREMSAERLERNRQVFELYFSQIEYLLQNGANPNTISNDGQTALHVLLKRVDLRPIVGGYARLFDVFFKNGFTALNVADVEGNTLLVLAEKHSLADAVEYLLAHGAKRETEVVVKEVKEVKPIPAAAPVSQLSVFAEPAAQRFEASKPKDEPLEKKNATGCLRGCSLI